MPRTSSVIRRSVAIGATLVLSTFGLSLGVGAANASTSTASVVASVFTKINVVHDDQAGGVDFVHNDFVDEYAAQVNAAEVKNKGAALTPAETPDPTKTLQHNGNDLDTLSFVASGPLSSTTATKIAAAFDAATPADFHTQFMDDNYAGVAVTTSKGKIYAEIVVITYDSAHLPQSRIFSSTPTITGTPDVGKTFTAHYEVTTPGTTTKYNWFSDGTLVQFGPSKTYLAQSPVFGTAITVEAETTEDGYQFVEPTSAPTKKLGMGTIAGHAPVVTGLRNVGESLHATSGGDWGPVFVTLTYAWLRNGKVIAGADTADYQAQDADLGKTVNVRVTGTVDHFRTVVKSTTSKTKVGIPVIPESSVPIIAPEAAPTVGDILTASNDPDWATGTAKKWQWKIDGRSVTGATKTTFTVPAIAYSKAGSTITVTETGTLAGFAKTSRTSLPTATVVGREFASVGDLAISGTVAPGSTVKAVIPTITPKPTTLKYGWYIAGVKKSTSSSFKIPASAGEADLAIQIIISKSGYTTTTITKVVSIPGTP
jgi:hypothetical protein